MSRSKIVALTFLACASGAHADLSSDALVGKQRALALAQQACDQIKNKMRAIQLAKQAGDTGAADAFARQIAELAPVCNGAKAASATSVPASPTGSEPQLGMTFQQAEATKWGKPTTVNERVQWVYMDSVTHQTKYLYFTNGRLSGIEQ